MSGKCKNPFIKFTYTAEWIALFRFLSSRNCEQTTTTGGNQEIFYMHDGGEWTLDDKIKYEIARNIHTPKNSTCIQYLFDGVASADTHTHSKNWSKLVWCKVLFVSYKATHTLRSHIQSNRFHFTYFSARNWIVFIFICIFILVCYVNTVIFQFYVHFFSSLVWLWMILGINRQIYHFHFKIKLIKK